MPRVLLFHHFGSQDVLPTDDEPVALFSTRSKVNVYLTIKIEHFITHIVDRYLLLSVC